MKQHESVVNMQEKLEELFEIAEGMNSKIPRDGELISILGSINSVRNAFNDMLINMSDEHHAFPKTSPPWMTFLDGAESAVKHGSSAKYAVIIPIGDSDEVDLCIYSKPRSLQDIHDMVELYKSKVQSLQHRLSFYEVHHS